ncbi:MAG: cupin domain-containing protein [Bryobacterales bacterium]|nr:cupin domain-containing protein [Bryobacterales bacterium]MBV9399064.1 cupin domain-containing protein [Bryobacterales bacterium]
MLALRRSFQFIGLAAAAIVLMPGRGAELDPKAITVTLPENIQWKKGQNNDTATLYGDPSKPGVYVQMLRWHAGYNSRPHMHSTDRYITVLSGNWYMGSGAKYDPDGMKPVPAGSFVIHHANEIHYDGAKGEDCVLYIVGTGPMTTTGAEPK